MSEETVIEDAIRKNAAGPKSAEVDGQKVEQHSLSDQIAADAYLASKKAVKSWGVQKSFSSPNDPLCEFLKFPRRVQKIISPQNDTNCDLFKYISS